MLKPQLLYQIDQKKGEVACMASLVPTFEPVEPQDAVITSESPESLEISEGRHFCFIFIVDRSGSMGGHRMETTKQALKLFIQSLPVGCQFAINCFGTNSTFIKQQGKLTVWNYNDANMKEIIS